MNRTFNWKPEFPERDDRAVTMCSDQLQTFSASREVGIVICEDVGKQSPACFWIDEQNVYLRMNWGTWYKVSNDSPETLSAICKRHTAKLVQVIGNRSVDGFIPVFHIDRLPPELFDGVPLDRGSSPKDVKTSETERQVSKPDEPHDLNLRPRLLLSRMIGRMGKVAGEYKTAAGEFFLIRSPKSLLLASFFLPEPTGWLADEMPLDDEPPLWFFKYGDTPSPLYEVSRAAKYLKTNFRIETIPVVILDDKVDIINIEHMREPWRETGVRVYYCECEKDGIPPFDLSLCPDLGEEIDDQTAAEAKKALDIYEWTLPDEVEEQPPGAS